MPKIYGKLLQGGPHAVEEIDSCEPKDVGYMLREYRMAFGKDWILWAGKKYPIPGQEKEAING